MSISRTRLGVMMGIACCCFGCKGAGGLGQALFAVFAVAKVATVVAEAAPSHNSEGGGEQSVVYVAQPPPGQTAPAPARCVELVPAPELPGDTFAVRTMACGGRVMVQDAQTGMWREHR
jgi:hypothetical protein